MHIPADVLNDSCGCSTVPCNQNYLTSASSPIEVLLHGAMAVFTCQDGGTLFTLLLTGNNGGTLDYGGAVPPINPPELWMNLWFHKLWCINRWLRRCVLGSSAAFTSFLLKTGERTVSGLELQTGCSGQTGEYWQKLKVPTRGRDWATVTTVPSLQASSKACYSVLVQIYINAGDQATHRISTIKLCTYIINTAFDKVQSSYNGFRSYVYVPL